MKTLLFAVAALCALANTAADAQTGPKREMRGVWVSTHISLDWPNRTQTPAQQRAALLGILDHNKATGVNAVFLQVRSQADAMYPSTLEPWSYYLTNQQGAAPSPLWDPLQFAIDESRKRGLEFHAWINPYRAVATLSNAGNNAMYAPNHVSRAHPEWMLTVGTVQILNPGIPAVRDHVHDVVMDIVNRYDIDGLHFDDYFYPNGTNNDSAAYYADPRGFPDTAAGRADWRRDNVNLLIERIGASIRAVKPWVKFGVSPSGIYRSSSDPAVGSPTSSGALQHYQHLFADTRLWLQSGWVDYLAPQVYWYMGQAGSDYSLLVPWWNQNAFDRHMYIGIADYKMNTTGWKNPLEVANQIALNRSQENVSGQIHFRHAFLLANPLGYRTDLKDRVYKKQAMLPAMPWKDSLGPKESSNVESTVNGDGSVTLAWAGPADSPDEFEKARRYAVYRTATRNFDLNDPANLLGMTDAGDTTYTDGTAQPGQYYFYTVTTLNRLHHESAPSEPATNDKQPPVVVTRTAERTLAGGMAQVTAEDVDGGTTDNWGIDSLQLSRSSFSCSDIGDNTVQLTATDKAGNVAAADATVRVLGAVPQPSVSSSAAAITLGYGAQSATLTASDAAAGSQSAYLWSPAAGLSGTSGAVTQFTPSVAGVYTFSVQAHNQNGCMATATVTVPVVEARCGDDGDKVSICKPTGSQSNPGTQVCVARNAVQALLKQGATLGACAAPQPL